MIVAGRLRIENWERDAIKRSKLVVDASVRFIGKVEAPANPPASTRSSDIAPKDHKPDDDSQ